MANLDELRQDILQKFQQSWSLVVTKILPAEAIDQNLTVRQLIVDFGGDMEAFMKSCKKLKRRGRKPKAVAQKGAKEVEPIRKSRRITLKGLDFDTADIELSLYRDQETTTDTIQLQNLDRQELVKMRDALRKAEEQTSKLLASLGY